MTTASSSVSFINSLLVFWKRFLYWSTSEGLVKMEFIFADFPLFSDLVSFKRMLFTIYLFWSLWSVSETTLTWSCTTTTTPSATYSIAKYFGCPELPSVAQEMPKAVQGCPESRPPSAVQSFPELIIDKSDYNTLVVKSMQY